MIICTILTRWQQKSCAKFLVSPCPCHTTQHNSTSLTTPCFLYSTIYQDMERRGPVTRVGREDWVKWVKIIHSILIIKASSFHLSSTFTPKLIQITDCFHFLVWWKEKWKETVGCWDTSDDNQTSDAVRVYSWLATVGVCAHVADHTRVHLVYNTTP